MGAYASLRWSELCALKRDDVDVVARTVRIDEGVVEVAGRFRWGDPKTTASARMVDRPEVVTKIVAAHLLRFPPLRDSDDPTLDGLLFYGEKLGPVRRHVFRPIWIRACEAAGVEPIRLECGSVTRVPALATPRVAT
jgi:integrase